MDLSIEREFEDDEEYAGFILREASLEDVEHYFVYNADRYAAVLLA